MKTRIPSLLVAAIVCCLSVSCSWLLTGCSTVMRTVEQTNAVLQAIDQLDVVEAHIPGRATSTHYTREEKDGVITSTLTHNNPGLSEPIKIVRKRRAAPAK